MVDWQAIEAELTCRICFDLVQTAATTPCAHTFCAHCINTALAHRAQCPVCNEHIPRPRRAVKRDQYVDQLVAAVAHAKAHETGAPQTAAQPTRHILLTNEQIAELGEVQRAIVDEGNKIAALEAALRKVVNDAGPSLPMAQPAGLEESEELSLGALAPARLGAVPKASGDQLNPLPAAASSDFEEESEEIDVGPPPAVTSEGLAANETSLAPSTSMSVAGGALPNADAMPNAEVLLGAETLPAHQPSAEALPSAEAIAPTPDRNEASLEAAKVLMGGSLDSISPPAHEPVVTSSAVSSPAVLAAKGLMNVARRADPEPDGVPVAAPASAADVAADKGTPKRKKDGASKRRRPSSVSDSAEPPPSRASSRLRPASSTRSEPKVDSPTAPISGGAHSTASVPVAIAATDSPTGSNVDSQGIPETGAGGVELETSRSVDGATAINPTSKRSEADTSECRSTTDATADDDDVSCCICQETTSFDENPIVMCSACDMAVHCWCYMGTLAAGASAVPEGDWFCDRCDGGKVRKLRCVACPNTTGAFKRTEDKDMKSDKKWAHVSCTFYLPETGFRDTERLERAAGFDLIDEARLKLKCSLCTDEDARRSGAKVQCAHKKCARAFHVTCAQQHKLKMEITDEGNHIYCSLHGAEATSVAKKSKSKRRKSV